MCNWTPDQNGPPADEYSSFGAYQRSLRLQCDSGVPGAIQWTPDHDTPDTVYYHCFTHRYLGWKITVLDSCERGQSSNIDEIYVQPDVPDVLQPAPSIRHETKIKPNDVYLLQNERKIDYSIIPSINNNNLENRNDKNNIELTKMIANGIMAAEALENSLKNSSASNDDATPLLNTKGEPILTTSIGPLPIYLTPPKSKTDHPFRYEIRNTPITGKNISGPYISPLKPQNRFKNYNSYPPLSNNRARYEEDRPPMYLNDRPESFRKNINERQRFTKISMPPPALRRDYTANGKNVPQFPQQNKPLSLQKHLLRGPQPSSFFTKQKFSSPIKISKKDLMIPSTPNEGFKPDSVVVESGFMPIMKRTDPINSDSGSSQLDMHDNEYDDYPESKQRRSDKISDDDDDDETEQPELLIKTFEPMFIPSPLDSTNMPGLKTPTKRLSGDLQYMEVEEGEDKMAMGTENKKYYLPPDNINNSKTTKLHPTIVAYDGRAVVDKSLDSEPDFPPPKRSGSIMSDISSTEQLLHLPQFGPFRGEIPPLSPELMRPNIVRSQPRSKVVSS